jgi:hypothetical protein
MASDLVMLVPPPSGGHGVATIMTVPTVATAHLDGLVLDSKLMTGGRGTQLVGELLANTRKVALMNVREATSKQVSIVWGIFVPHRYFKIPCAAFDNLLVHASTTTPPLLPSQSRTTLSGRNGSKEVRP